MRIMGREMSGSECPYCHGMPLGTTDGPDGLQHPLVCGWCTPLPASVLRELEDEDRREPT